MPDETPQELVINFDLEELFETVADRIEEEEIEYFGIAASKSSRQVRILRDMALTAYDHRSKKRALSIFSFEWGLSAGNMARAVVRHPEWFRPGSEATVTDLRILFVLAQLDAGDDAQFYKQWRKRQTLQPYEMQRMVSKFKKRKVQAKQKNIKLRAQAIHVNLDTKIASMELATSDTEALGDVTDGGTYTVRMSPVKS